MLTTARIAELEKDRARLDWLEMGPCFAVTLPMPEHKANGTL
jgi:hypothetical protein